MSRALTVAAALAQLAGALALLAAAPAHAEITPLPGPVDPHIQQVGYDPQEVVALHVMLGFAVTVQFAADERIETVTLGDAAGWAVQSNRRADHLVIKPLTSQSATNLTVITDQRVYNFSLYGAVPGSGVQPYLLRFSYAAPMADAPAKATAAPARYKLHGDRSLWPQDIAEDGGATHIRWAQGSDIPAVYAQDGRSSKALVNGLMKDGVYTIEGVHDGLVFMLGKARATATRQREGQP